MLKLKSSTPVSTYMYRAALSLKTGQVLDVVSELVLCAMLSFDQKVVISFVCLVFGVCSYSDVIDFHGDGHYRRSSDRGHGGTHSSWSGATCWRYPRKDIGGPTRRN